MSERYQHMKYRAFWQPFMAEPKPERTPVEKAMRMHSLAIICLAAACVVNGVGIMVLAVFK